MWYEKCDQGSIIPFLYIIEKWPNTPLKSCSVHTDLKILKVYLAIFQHYK